MEAVPKPRLSSTANKCRNNRFPSGPDPYGTLAKWNLFLANCVLNFIDPDRFEPMARLLSTEYPVLPGVLADLLLRPSTKSSYSIKPRLTLYFEVLLRLDLIQFPGVMRGLYVYSTAHRHASGSRTKTGADHADGAGTLCWQNSYQFEEMALYRMAKAFTQGVAVRSPDDVVAVVPIMSRWMNLFADVSAAFEAAEMSGTVNIMAKEEMLTTRVAFVAVLLHLCDNMIVFKTLRRAHLKKMHKNLAAAMTRFVPTLNDHGLEQVVTRLEMFRAKTLADLYPLGKSAPTTTKTIDDLVDGSVWLENYILPDRPIDNSRAGLYIYLNAALAGRPLIDDRAILTFLHNRYQGHGQTAFIALILASFDVLANSVFRNEGEKVAHLLRSYLINKVPLLLAQLTPTLFAVTPEYCVSEALRKVDTNAFPTLSSMFDDTRNNNNSFTESVREYFCFACCLHGLLPQANIEAILGETPYQSLPSGGRYTKEGLVQDCMADPEKTQTLIAELDNIDGNVGAVCQALTEVLGKLCASKETMSVKSLCSQLVQKPLALDVMLLFEKPYTILQPLCELLDGWRHEDDQTEYQPVYEEFGSVMLLVLAFACRYGLSPWELGVSSTDSFVYKLLTHGHLSRPLEELNDQEKAHIHGWIIGLFSNDGGGLGDELMSSSPPQDFYLLMPTLFHQVAVGFATGSLSEEQLKNGVEYLVETFLLPSLVTAIRFLTDQLWVDKEQEQKAIMKILQLILVFNSNSHEVTATMVTAVINAVAKPLQHALQFYQKRDPKSQEVEPLLRAIRESIPLSRRTGSADHSEIESWSSSRNTGSTTGPATNPLAPFRHTIEGLVQWGLHSGLNTMPTSYTHRQVLVALNMFGARRVLRVILDEVRVLTNPAEIAVAYDVAAALVCAPDLLTDMTCPPSRPRPLPETLLDSDDNGGDQRPSHLVPPQTRLSLRETLRYLAEHGRKIQKVDPSLVEATIRLYRHVETQLLPLPAEVGIGVDVQDADAMLQGALGLGDDAVVAAAVAVGDAMAVDTGLDLDMGMGGDPVSLGGDAGRVTASDDIFGGLGVPGGGADLLDGWEDIEGMDLT